MIIRILAISQHNNSLLTSSFLRVRGFTILEMVVVLVMIGLVTSLALPGLQRMYDSMSDSLERDEVNFALNGLALDVRNQGQSLYFTDYPNNKDPLPMDFLSRLEKLDVKIKADQPILVTYAGFCPVDGQLIVQLSSRKYPLVLRSPDCRVVAP